MVQLPTCHPSTPLAMSHQGQGAGAGWLHRQSRRAASPAQGAAGAASTSPGAGGEGAAGCRGGWGETTQAAQIDCDSPRKAEPGGGGKIQVSFLFLTICSPSAVGGTVITAIHHAGLACHPGCRLRGLSTAPGLRHSLPRPRWGAGFGSLVPRFGPSRHKGHQPGGRGGDPVPQPCLQGDRCHLTLHFPTSHPPAASEPGTMIPVPPSRTLPGRSHAPTPACQEPLWGQLLLRQMRRALGSALKIREGAGFGQWIGPDHLQRPLPVPRVLQLCKDMVGAMQGGAPCPKTHKRARAPSPGAGWGLARA